LVQMMEGITGESTLSTHLVSLTQLLIALTWLVTLK